jgi:hypothetical protein
LNDVSGDLDQRPDDAERRAVEVERVITEPDRLAPPQARSPTGPNKSPVAVRHDGQ